MPVQHRNLTHPNVKPFRQHGFIPTKESGKSQVYGNCVFCGKSEKFFVNVDTKAWDCKVCGKSGGFQSWIREILVFSQTHFNGPVREALSTDRKVSPDTLKRAGIGFNPRNKSYVIPAYTMDGQKLNDLRIYKGKKMLATAGCKTGLFGWELFNLGYTKLWLCEGEWDCLAMREALTNTNRTEEIVLAVPGAMVFKNEWTVLFKQMNVNVVYDNDDAGRNGSIKIYNKISRLCSNIKFLHWRETEKDGADIRDVYQKLSHKPAAFIKRLEMKLKDKPQGIEKSDVKITANINVFNFDGDGHTAEEVRAVYTKWLELKSTDVIDVLYGTMIANRLPGDPIWLLLVAASGGTKSELLMSFDDVINITSVSTITPHTLISGASFAGGGDPSLIPRLDQRILTIKDLTTLLNMNVTQREEIFGQLRDAYDGKASKQFGNGLIRTYESKFGVVAGVTPIIEIFTEGQTALGERFLRWFVPDPKSIADERIICKRAMDNSTHEEDMRSELKKIAKETLLFDYKTAPVVSDKIKNKIMDLAQWTAMLRGTINRDKFTKEVTHKPFKELATRLSKQYYKQLLGIGMFRNLKEVTEKEYDLLRHLGVSTIPSRMRAMLSIMYREGIERGWDLKVLEGRLRLPYNTCERIADDLRMLGALKKVNGRKLRNEWVLTSNLKQLTEGARLWQKEN